MQASYTRDKTYDYYCDFKKILSFTIHHESGYNINSVHDVKVSNYYSDLPKSTFEFTFIIYCFN